MSSLGRPVALFAYALSFVAALGAGYWAAAPRQILDSHGKPIKSGRLRLRTFPPGASVWIDGELKVESTPATLVLPAGSYELKIQGEGALPLYQSVKIEAGDAREMNINIPRAPDATLTVLSDAEGAQVRVNGFVRGQTPLSRAVTKPGPIDMTVAIPGRARSVRAELEIGEQKVVQVFFGEPISEARARSSETKSAPICEPPATGYLTLGLAPEGEIFDDEERLLGRSPLVKHALTPGTHDLILRARTKEAQYEKRVSVEIEEDRTAIFRFRFTDQDRIGGGSREPARD